MEESKPNHNKAERIGTMHGREAREKFSVLSGEGRRGPHSHLEKLSYFEPND